MTLNETKRLVSVKRFEQYEFNLNKGLEDILTLTAEICNTPVAFLTLIDDDTQWFKVSKGMEVFQMPRATSFCTYTIMDTAVMVVPDPTKDERFAKIPLVLHQPHIRFYAGAPLAADDGQNVGTLCVFDDHTRDLTSNQRDMLSILAKQAIHLMELELCLKLLQHKTHHIEKQNKALMEIAFTQAHEFRGPLSSIMGFMNLIKDDNYESPREHLEMMAEAVQKLDEKILLVVKSTHMARDLYEVGG